MEKEYLLMKMEMDDRQFEESCKKVVDFVIGQGFEMYRNGIKRSVMPAPIDNRLSCS